MKRILSGALLALLAALPAAAAQDEAVVSGQVTNTAGAPEAAVMVRIAEGQKGLQVVEIRAA